MPSECMRDAIHHARMLAGALQHTNACGGMTAQEHSANGRLARAIEAYLDEVGFR